MTKKKVGASIIMAVVWLISGWAASASNAPSLLYYVLSVLCLILAAISELIDEVRETGKEIARAMSHKTAAPTSSTAIPLTHQAKPSATAKAPDVLVID